MMLKLYYNNASYYYIRHAESDAERAVRRESYLKATWAERMHVDSDASEDDHAQHHQQQDVPGR